MRGVFAMPECVTHEAEPCCGNDRRGLRRLAVDVREGEREVACLTECVFQHPRHATVDAVPFCLRSAPGHCAIVEDGSDGCVEQFALRGVGGFPGAQINVQVDWSVPNLMGGLLSFIGGDSSDADIKGKAMSVFRQEGW